MQKIRIRTKDKLIFDKLSTLQYKHNTIMQNTKSVARIVNSINKTDKLVEKKEVGNKIMLRRLKPLNLGLELLKTRR